MRPTSRRLGCTALPLSNRKCRSRQPRSFQITHTAAQWLRLHVKKKVAPNSLRSPGTGLIAASSPITSRQEMPPPSSHPHDAALRAPNFSHRAPHSGSGIAAPPAPAAAPEVDAGRHSSCAARERASERTQRGCLRGLASPELPVVRCRWLFTARCRHVHASSVCKQKRNTWGREDWLASKRFALQCTEVDTTINFGLVVEGKNGTEGEEGGKNKELIKSARS